MLKQQRNYNLAIQRQDGDGTVLVRPPFTIEFDIYRTYYNTDNRVMISIYNLNQKTRESIFKDYWRGFTIRTVTLQAGYGDGNQLPRIFSGKISSCWSVRRGTNFITTVEAYDPGTAVNSIIPPINDPITYPQGTSNNAIIRDLVSRISGVPFILQAGEIQTVPGQVATPYLVDKPILSTIHEVCESNGYFAFIDNQTLNILPKNVPLTITTVAAGGSPNKKVINLIDASTGLIGTPKREGGQLFFDVIFDPSVQVGQQVLLLSQTASAKYLGQYMINTVQHKGIISENRGGELTTTIGAFYVGAFANV